MKKIMKNRVIEFKYESEKRYAKPFVDISFGMVVTLPDGSEKKIPGFWGGHDIWKIRFSSQDTGIHTFITYCSDSSNASLHGKLGEVEVTEYKGDNPMYLHGPVKAAPGKKHLEYDDGKPFFWLGDTWWMGFTDRLGWPDDFKMLTDDRLDKGFNVVQIIAGLYPDMEWGDKRGRNEAGLPWDMDFESVNPEYFRHADKKIQWLCEKGIMPCIVGSWGYFLKLAGEKAMMKHWDYLIARWGAYPVAWCVAGEALMPFYNDKKSLDDMERYKKETKEGWTRVAKHIKTVDPYNRLLTIHPGHNESSRNMIGDVGLIDLNMMQTGHSGYASYAKTVEMTREEAKRKPPLPVIDSEVCYEGICGSSFEDVQRFMFWSCVLGGACGHTYGANGIWQMNSKQQPYGPSPHGLTWGDTPWQEAYKLPGSRQLGMGKKLLERYEWWKFEEHPEWVDKTGLEKDSLGYFAAGIPGQIRMIFIHINEFGAIWNGVKVKDIEQDVLFKAYWFDPVTGEEQDRGRVCPDDDGCWNAGRPKKLQDFVLVLEKVD